MKHTAKAMVAIKNESVFAHFRQILFDSIRQQNEVLQHRCHSQSVHQCQLGA